jgi:c-di-GMP-binding flagellar brake protein YcgR
MSINNREHPRFESKSGKWVKIQKEGSKVEIYQLIDLSRGGLSFIILDAKEFKRGNRLLIIEFKDKIIEKPLLAIVRYVKVNIEIEDKYTDYKVGVEFLKK